MLRSLEIRDFALIKVLRVDWTPGFNILTGETGAGKSILIDALNSVLGGKAGPSFIRAGADKSYIEAEFACSPLTRKWLEQNELVDESGETTEILTICREITRSGSKVRINGVLISHGLAQELAQHLVTIHAQHEARTLMSPQAQLDMLDRLGDQSHKKLVEHIRILALKRKELQRQHRELQISEEERFRRLDFVRFQLNELNEAALDNSKEDEELTQRQRILANVSQLEMLINNAYDVLVGEAGDGSKCAVDLLQTALSETEKASRLDDSLVEPRDLINSGLDNIEEAARSLRKYVASLDIDPESLASIEARLTVLAGVKRKYGPTLVDAIALKRSLLLEFERLDGAQTKIDELSSELREVEVQLSEQAEQLSRKRKKLGSRLSALIEQELKELGMERCKFEIAFDRGTEISVHGYDRVEFVIAPNPGQPLQPLSKIASGGELSRVMLAVKSIFAEADEISTVIFDEIDTGLSGRVLQSMREKLARLALSHQILCITHQPIIASIADNHIHIRKEQSAAATEVYATKLDHEGRLRSLAAMASGQENQEVALTFARSLLAQASDWSAANCKGQSGQI